MDNRLFWYLALVGSAFIPSGASRALFREKLGVRARPGSLPKKGVAMARTVTPDPARDSRVRT